jgi:DNA repair exonuclease SbcCD ATPase subunit
MSEFDLKRDKTKAFKATPETIEKINAIIKKSGKGDIEFFEDLVQDLSIRRFTEGTEEISQDLHTHFKSDVQKLKNATDSIISIFTSQMENLVVEKDKWNHHTDKLIAEKNEVIEKQEETNKNLTDQVNQVNQELTELTKVYEDTKKERETFQKQMEVQEQLIQDRNEKIEDLKERINKLNEIIVDKEDLLKEVEPMKQQKAKLEEQNKELLLQIENLKAKFEEDLQKQEEKLVFECEKGKHQQEISLRETFQEEKEQIRTTTRQETEQAIRVFYLEEMKRRDEEVAAKEKSYQSEINELKKQLESLQKQPSSRNPKNKQKEQD